MRIMEDDTIEDVMRDDPATIRTFLDFGFACIGCPVSSFHTVAFACREHDGADVEYAESWLPFRRHPAG